MSCSHSLHVAIGRALRSRRGIKTAWRCKLCGSVFRSWNPGEHAGNDFGHVNHAANGTTRKGPAVGHDKMRNGDSCITR